MISKLAKNYLGTTIPLINITGVITSQLTDSVVKRLANINTTRAVALAVVVNSPGGLPVQSEIISEKLQSYSKKHNLKLYTFARDIAASGGYMILSAGDHVVADTTSIVGSIGVVIQKMHFQGILDKLHFDHKQFNTQDNLLHGILSPYNKLDPESEKYLRTICEQSHEKFVADVKQKRGNKVKNDPTTFSGDVFSGKQALQRGLVDQVGSMIQVLSQRHPGAKLDIEPQRRSLLHRVLAL